MTKREEILYIAADLFAKNGFENTPLSLICETANVSKGLISHHFKTKNGLLREIFSNTTDQMKKMNEVHDCSLSPKEKLLRIIESFFQSLQDNKLLLQFNLNTIVQPNTKAILSDLIDERSGMILESTLELFSNIDKENALSKSHLFIAEMDGIALNYLGIYKNFPLQEVKTQTINKYQQL